MAGLLGGRLQNLGHTIRHVVLPDHPKTHALPHQPPLCEEERGGAGVPGGGRGAMLGIGKFNQKYSDAALETK